MTLNTNLHSNALNFTSYTTGGVDPRTGQYTVAIELPELGGNDRQGPEFQPKLFFNPLNDGDSGYGWGWNLQISQYTPHNQMLSLSTGESLKITDRSSRPMKLREQQLASFHVYPEDDDGLRVVHHSGVVEILKEQGTSQHQVYLTTRLLSPLGHSLTFQYQRFDSRHPVLHTITDGTGRMLLRLTRHDQRVELEEHPHQGPDGAPLARYSMILANSDRRVARIELPTDELASWRFEYATVLGKLCVTQVDTPTGAREYLNYHDGGHQFPQGSGLMPLPRVTGHRIDARFGQPALAMTYEYPGIHNFLGGGTQGGWDDSGLDNLYRHLGPYEYGSNEILKVDDVEVRRIERRFDRFHLPVRESSIENGHENTLLSAYDVDYEKHFIEQQPWFQLQTSQERRWTLPGHLPPSRSELERSTYDTYGNLLTRTEANGVTQSNVWHPADEEGFVRHLAQQTTVPAADSDSAAAVICERYEYLHLPALKDSGLPGWKVRRSENVVDMNDGERLLRSIEHHYTLAAHDASMHGRPSRKIQLSNHLQTVTEFHYSSPADAAGGQSLLQVQTTVIGFDGAEQSSLEQRSLFTGELVFRQDRNGVQTRYEHDALRRLVRETEAPGTDKEASQHYEYVLCAAYGEQASQQLTNTRGVHIRSLLDSFGRVVSELRDHALPNNPSAFVETLAVRYDRAGRVTEETRYDQLDNERPLTLTQTYLYDDWGERYCRIAPDGVQWHERTDPLGDRSHSGRIVHRHRQAGSAVVGRTQTWLDAFDNPLKQMRLDDRERVVAERTWRYDGLGRCILEKDERGHEQHFTYDAWGRVLEVRLPDNSRVQRRYAGHSDGDLPISVQVLPGNETERKSYLGAQAFDGTDRLKVAGSGPRLERYEYRTGETRARRKVVADGQAIDYEYDLAHSRYPLSSTAPDDQATFAYHPVSAHVTQCENDQGTLRYRYDTDDRLQHEQLERPDGTLWSTEHSYSLLGLPLTSTDQDGMATVRDYDEHGRIRTLAQGPLSVQISYDTLGRTDLLVSCNTGTADKVECHIEYDDQDREWRRTWGPPGQAARTQVLTWGLDGLLDERNLQQGQVELLKETFNYNPRGQLLRHQCSGLTPPKDSQGRAYRLQTFIYDAYDNVKESTTTFLASGRERAQYRYRSDDPCQLHSVTYTPARTTQPHFRYDRNGNLIEDQNGRALSYDSQNRLRSVDGNAYHYDGHNQLQGYSAAGEPDTLLFYQGNRLSLAVSGATRTYHLHLGDQPFAQQEANNPGQALLLQTTASHSVIAERQAGVQRDVVYSAYGWPHAEAPLQAAAGYNGEVFDASSGCYLLGRGYRAYSPELMRFHSPDALSPFGDGGLNYYGYCHGNPITFQDPTGHVSSRPRRSDEDLVYQPDFEQPKEKHPWLKWLFVGIAIVATIAAVVTAGKAAVAAVVAWKAVGLLAAGKALTAVAYTVGAGAAITATGFQIDHAITGNETSGEMAVWFSLASMALVVGPSLVNAASKMWHSLANNKWRGFYSLVAKTKTDVNVDEAVRLVSYDRVGSLRDPAALQPKPSAQGPFTSIWNRPPPKNLRNAIIY